MHSQLKKQISDYLYSQDFNQEQKKEMFYNGIIKTIKKDITDKVVSCLQNDQVIPQILADTYNSIEKYWIEPKIKFNINKKKLMEEIHERFMIHIAMDYESEQEISTEQVNDYDRVCEIYELIGEPDAA